MDPLFILIVILILVALGAFIAVLRGSPRPQAPRPAVSRPPAASATVPPPAQAAMTAAPPAQAAITAAPTAPAPAVMPTAGAPAAPAAPEATPAAPGADAVSPPVAVASLVEPGATGDAGSPPIESQGPTGMGSVPRGESGESGAMAPADDARVASSAGAEHGVLATMDAVGQPPTRSGEIHLAVSPQRLPYRFAELVGEQRQLEEAITLLHRRIDDEELGADPTAYESRVRLGVLRQELSHKQERLREILFLQDGYRWLQQHMALDRVPDEAATG